MLDHASTSFHVGGAVTCCAHLLLYPCHEANFSLLSCIVCCSVCLQFCIGTGMLSRERVWRRFAGRPFFEARYPFWVCFEENSKELRNLGPHLSF